MTKLQSLEKRKKPFIKLKNFTKKVNANLVFAKVFNSLIADTSLYIHPYNNKIKIFFYRFLKIIKIYKTNNSSSLFRFKENFGSKFQANGFYTSLTEVTKNNKIKILKLKILISNNRKIVQNSFQKFSFADFPQIENKSLKGLSKGFEKFEKLYGDYSKTGEKRRSFLRTLKTKRFFNRVFISRLFIYSVKGRKKYKNMFSYLFKRRRKINSLFHIYTLSSLKFKDVKKQRRKVFKKLAWKIKKQKKWRRLGSFGLFRLRQKLSQVFYVPKHFEINYKTLTTNYLGYTDSKTTNTRISFWLNLRKLVTFLS